MDVSIDLRADRLDCGARLADLVEQVADGGERTEHQLRCQYCRAALTELTLRWAPLRDVATAPVEVPSGLYRAIMARLRRLASGDDYARWLSAAGTTRVGTWVLAQICTEAARCLPGVSAVRGARVRPTDVPEARDGLPVLTVRVEIIVATDQSLPAVAEDVRGAVVDDLSHYAGLPAVVDVEIVDIAGPDG